MPAERDMTPITARIVGSSARPLRVALMTRVTLAHSAGGMETQAEALRQALVTAGHRVMTFTTTLASGPEMREDAWGVTRYLAGGAPGAYSRAWDAALLEDFLAEYARDPFDLVASQSAAAFAYLAARPRLPPDQQAPVVLMNHGTVAATFPAHLREVWSRPARTLLRQVPTDARAWWSDRRRYPQADHITALSDGDRRAMIRWLGVAPERITVIANGVDTSAFRLDPELRSATRARFGLVEGEIAVAILGRLERRKGQQVMLDALASAPLRDVGGRLRLILIGEGPARERLALQAAQLGLRAGVIFAGPAAHAEIPALLNGADIVAAPSLVEAMPLALLEAMACGRAIVASRVGAIANVIIPEENGLIVPAGDALALARAVTRLVDDEALRARLGGQAREGVVARHDAAATMRQYIDVFTQTAGRARTGITPSATH
jgi:glycosyltransferase involved in cell wall biosynthesis